MAISMPYAVERTVERTVPRIPEALRKWPDVVIGGLALLESALQNITIAGREPTISLRDWGVVEVEPVELTPGIDPFIEAEFLQA